ncbi:hypothetical protein ACFFGH_34205 [Lysobacter korlensis]|uniref:Uncharacterized protein n=1 Tax=Lysobacter korlensis TaxID=553636 RepID=A0ABV6S103_9GAMM
MSEPRRYLQKRYGESIAAPSESELGDAVMELFNENLPGITDADYAEHGAAHLRYGFDEGPMFVVEVARTGEATLEEWSDQDYEEKICPSKTISVTAQQALDLWLLLAAGRIDEVRAAFRGAA